MKSHLLPSACLATALIGLVSPLAQAQNPGFAPGDLILGFQSTGTGNASYVLANLGQAGTIRDAATNISLISGPALNNVLKAQYGDTWYDRTDLFMGLFACGSNDEFSGFFVNGDPYNTLYLGAPRQSVGQAGSAATGGFMLSENAVQQAANGMWSSSNRFEESGTGAVSVISKSVSFTDYDDENPISGGIQGASWYGVFPGGTQSVFGPGAFGTLGGVSAEAALDLYRIQGVNNQPGQAGFGQPIGMGTFEGTVLIDNLGQVSLIAIPEPSVAGLLGLASAFLGLSRRRRNS